MEHQLNDHGLVTILRLKGDLTFQEIEDLGDILHRVVHDTNGEIVVDMSNVGYADSTVAGQIVAAKREAEVKRRGFVLSNLSPTVKKVLHTGHADNLVTLYDTTEEAIADLADRARGGEPRRIVPNIKCGHDDCVFYTYAKTEFNVVPACEYAYPEEITNGPDCRCYRVNWKELQGFASQEQSPFRRRVKKESPYSLRDRYREEHPQIPEPPSPSPPQPMEDSPSVPNHHSSGSQTAPLEPGHASPPTSGDDLDHEIKQSPPIPSPTSQQNVPESTPDVVADPFADENFPSSDTDSSQPETPRSSEPLLEILPTEKPESPTPPVPQHPRTDDDAPVVSEPPQVEEEGTEEVQKAEPQAAEHVEAEPKTPMEVVRTFVNAWNTGQFGVEYDCLSSQSKAFDKEDYFARRRTLKTSQFEKNGRAVHQGIADEISHTIQENVASVEITRLDRTPKGARCYAQYYTLHREEGHWKIQSVRDGESRKNPTVPPKGRKLNASQFFGKSEDLKGRPGTSNNH